MSKVLVQTTVSPKVRDAADRLASGRECSRATVLREAIRLGIRVIRRREAAARRAASPT